MIFISDSGNTFTQGSSIWMWVSQTASGSPSTVQVMQGLTTNLLLPPWRVPCVLQSALNALTISLICFSSHYGQFACSTKFYWMNNQYISYTIPLSKNTTIIFIHSLTDRCWKLIQECAIMNKDTMMFCIQSFSECVSFLLDKYLKGRTAWRYVLNLCSSL